MQLLRERLVRTLPTLVALALVSLLVAPGAVQAATPHQTVMLHDQYIASGTIGADYTSSPQGLWNTGYGYPVMRGDTITFTNLESIPHTVTACIQCWPYPKYEPTLFNSRHLTFGQSWTLDTATLAPGTYRYFCEHHVFQMRGSFTVLP